MNSIIQILRGQRESLKKQKASITLEDGQLLYNKTDNYISVGNSLDNDNSLLKDPIAVKELHGNVSEDLQSKDNSSPYDLGQYDYILKHNGEDLYLNNKIGAVKIHSETEVQVLNEITESSSDEAVIRNKELKAAKEALQNNITEAEKSLNKKLEDLSTNLESEISRSTNFDNSHNNIENNNNGSILKNANNNCSDYKSFLYGDHLTATADYQAIFGQYNDISSTALLAVGGGTSDESKNLFEVSSEESKFNTKLKVSEAPTEMGDVLRWGDLEVSQDGSEGTYLTGIEFNGKTLKYTKGSVYTGLGTSKNSSETAKWVVYGVNGRTLQTCDNLDLDGTIEASSFNASSDKRLKENIKSFNCENSILDLPIYTFNFKSDDNKIKHVGCLAQDLQKICPELVHENGDGYLSIEENKLVYLLLDEVKQLKEKLKDLEVR